MNVNKLICFSWWLKIQILACHPFEVDQIRKLTLRKIRPTLYGDNSNRILHIWLCFSSSPCYITESQEGCNFGLFLNTTSISRFKECFGPLLCNCFWIFASVLFLWLSICLFRNSTPTYCSSPKIDIILTYMKFLNVMGKLAAWNENTV